MTGPTIPLTQKAAVLDDCGKDYVVKTDWPVTQPSELKPNECLVKLEYSGVCHSDVSVKNASWGVKPKLPLVGGHEGIGRIVAIGPHHTKSPLKIGDRVGIKWISHICNHCNFCHTGDESSCLLGKTTTHGFMLHGTFQEYVVSYIDYVTPIPEELDGATATPLLCAGLTVYKAIKQANLKIGQWIAITGAGGGLGHLGVQYAAAMGLRVIAIDTGDSKKELVLKLGAEKWIDFKESKDLVKDVQEATNGGPQAAVIVTGHPLPFNQAIGYLRPTGTLVAVGVSESTLNVPLVALISKSLHIVGSAIGSRLDISEAVSIAALGKVKCQTEIRELEDINRIFSDLETAKIPGRVVIRLNPDQPKPSDSA